MMLALALVSGGVAALLALRYLREQTTPLMAREPASAQIVVAARQLPVGAVVAPTDVKVVPWPGDALPTGYLSDTSQVVGRGLTTRVAENEPFLTAKLSTKEEGGGLPIIIKDGMRAMSVRVDQIVGVAGFVIPGTRVDVLLSLAEDPKYNRPQPLTRTLLQNMLVLAAGQVVERDIEGKPLPASVITLLVTPEEAEILTLATREGTLQMALRNPLDTLMVTTVGAQAGQLTGVRQAAATTRSPRPRPVVTAPREQPRVIVEAYRGGERTLTTFQKP
jgi:pilus assembly protein CpaB